MPSSHLILCRPLLLPSIFPNIKVFSNGSALCFRWPKYRNFSSSISLSNEYSCLISFRIDRFDMFAVQGLSRVFSSIWVFSNESALSHQVAKVLELQLQHQYFNEYCRLISCRNDQFDPLDSRDSQESSPASQFKSINSLALSFLNPHIYI